MKLTRKQLIYLIKENLNEVGDIIPGGGIVFTRKELEQFFNKLKEVGIEIKEGTGLLKGTKVVWIDNINKLGKLPIGEQYHMDYWRPVGNCHIYELYKERGLKSFNAFFKTVGVKKFKVYLEAEIKVRSLGGTSIFGSQIAATLADPDHQDLMNFEVDNCQHLMLGTPHRNRTTGKFVSIHVPHEKASLVLSFNKEMADLDVCNENIPAMKTLELKDLIRKPKKKGKPAGPDALKDLAKSQVTSEPFEEDRLGPSKDVRPVIPPQYATGAERKGQWMTQEELTQNNIDKNSLPSKDKLQRGVTDYYWVMGGDFELEKLINPEFDLPDDLDLD
tara:strand:+ start:1240 stop:2235 length:996 start_codon:yes stop_codon:yes gene_type:complete